MTDRTMEISSLNLAAARELADTALRLAGENELSIHVTIVDHAGHVLIYQCMEQAPFPGRAFSEKKAYTAVSFKKPTSVWKQRLTDNPHLAAGLSQHPQIAMIGGGEPVIVEGQVVGAIGIAGGLEGEDILVAKETLAMLGYPS